jgi:hypothetical protein
MQYVTRRRLVVSTLCFLCLLGGVSIERALAQQPALSGQLAQFLKNDLKFSDGNLSAINSGVVVTNVLESKVKREVAVVSAAWINLPRAEFLKQYETAKLNIEMAAADIGGKFGESPQPADLQTLTIPPNDLKEFKKCEVASCKIKASEEAIAAFRKLDNKAADFQAQAETLLRQQIVGYVAAYIQQGNAGLMTYRDKENPVRVADEFADILKQSPYLNTYYPELRNVLENFPQATLPQGSSEFYWMVENFGGKANRPTVTASQFLMYQPASQSETVVVSKQLYANHYYEAALGLTIMADAPDMGKPGFYLIHVNRARIDALREVPKMMAGDVFTGAQELLHKKMTTVKERTEKLRQGQ